MVLSSYTTTGTPQFRLLSRAGDDEQEDVSHVDPPSTLLLLPVELRLKILDYILGPTKACSLYLTRHIWSWSKRRNKRTFLGILLVCHQMHDEAVDILHRRHELLLYTDHIWDLQPRDLVRSRICAIEDYARVFQRVQKLRLTLFVTGNSLQDDVLVALLGWLMAVLQERRRPLRSLTLEFCAMNWKLDHKPTAVMYAAQKFRSLGPTTLTFQCGFSGVENEDAMEALMQHANEKIKRPTRVWTSKEALKELLIVHARSRPAGYWSKVLSNRWFGTTLSL